MTQWDEDRKIAIASQVQSVRDALAEPGWPWTTPGTRLVATALVNALAAALERIAELEAGLRDIALWCEEGWEPVSVWPAERARCLLSQDKPNG